jgi:hypothetical protein
MTIMISMNRARAIAVALIGGLLTLPAAKAQAQVSTITGKVTSEFGQPVDAANVYINDLTISVVTNAQGTYTITIPAARVSGQQVNLRVRAIGYQPGLRPIRVTAGSQSQDFALKQDINRLNEVVVTGSMEATPRANVPFAVGRLTSEDIPVPALDPITALQGKVAGVRIASTRVAWQPAHRSCSAADVDQRGGAPAAAHHRRRPSAHLRDGGPWRSYRVGRVVKGAAGASLYGTRRPTASSPSRQRGATKRASSSTSAAVQLQRSE